MGNKYYIPKSQEFCIGFEYEQAEVDIFENTILKPEKWKKDSIKINTFDKICMYNELVGNIRVKYLDEQDILDLGFIKTQEDKTHTIYVRFDSNFGIYFYSDDRRKILIYSDVYDYEGCIFDGSIKNKSELQKLIIQLEK